RVGPEALPARPEQGLAARAELPRQSVAVAPARDSLRYSRSRLRPGGAAGRGGAGRAAGGPGGPAAPAAGAGSKPSSGRAERRHGRRTQWGGAAAAAGLALAGA